MTEKLKTKRGRWKAGESGIRAAASRALVK